MTGCPRCAGSVAAGQEYCLECGLRLPVTARVGHVPVDRRKAAIPIVVAALVAIAGAAAGIGLTRDADPAPAAVTATGGSLVVPTPTVESEAELAEWPAGLSAWTNILVSLPKVEGRGAAVARAGEARQRGLRRVGVLDSSRYASLHPGYWVVFVGVYPSAPEAASRLGQTKAVQRGARTARVSP